MFDRNYLQDSQKFVCCCCCTKFKKLFILCPINNVFYKLYNRRSFFEQRRTAYSFLIIVSVVDSHR